MLESLRAWLNGNREFRSGALLYRMYGTDARLKELFSKGHNDYRQGRLEACLRELFDNENGKLQRAGKQPENDPAKVQESTTTGESKPNEPTTGELYAATKMAADKLYKETMNKRAVLFSMTRGLNGLEPNTEERIRDRSPLAMEVVIGFIQASQAYDRAEFVLSTGRLPGADQDAEPNEYDQLPDELVKPTLDNLRKNFNKMRKREATIERVALLMKHKVNIEKLEKRWHSLKSVRQ